MGTTELPDGLVKQVGPPSEENATLSVSQRLSLGLQIVWLSLLLIYDILVDGYYKLFPPPPKSLKGKVVLVTGAGRGLGKGLALGFAREGCKVAVVDINIDNAANTAAEITDAGGVAKAYYCNVASSDDIRALRQSVTSDLGDVDILVNNAGLVFFGQLLEDCSEGDLKAVIDVNLMSHFWMAREFLPRMKARNSGHIVAVASAAAYTTGETGSAYITSKFGIRGLMGAIYSEVNLRPDNEIRTTTVYPYFINTSADYVSRWKIRIPPMEIEDAVEVTINGVKSNSESVFVPGSVAVCRLAEFVPTRTYHRFKKMFFDRVIPFPREGGCSSPATQSDTRKEK